MNPFGTLILRPCDSTMFYTYSVRNHEGRCMFVGYDKLAGIASLTKVRGNPVVDLQQSYKIELYSIHARELDASNAVSALLKVLSPNTSPAWQHSTHMNRYMPIMCEQTGDVFKSAGEACRLLGIPPSRMSLHLARKPGHKTIKGMTFNYHNFYDREADLRRAGFNPDGTRMV